MKVCSRCGEKNPDKARYCMTCATPLAPEAAPPSELRKTVTVLFCDVAGSTALGERLDPETVRRVMSRYFDRAREVLERHGATVEKFIGDAVMAVFGIPSTHEDDALRAVHAAAELRESLVGLNSELEQDWGVNLAVRIGVNTGAVVAGETSMGQALVTGDVVNVAARLEQMASPGEVLVGDATYRLVRDSVRVEARPPLSAKGKHLPLVAFRLLEMRFGAGGAGRRMDSPLVGRGPELVRLDEALQECAATSSVRLTTIIGSAGIGKSRLAFEFLRRIGPETRILRGRCLPYGEGITFWPITEVVRDAAGITGEESAGQARQKVASLMAAEPEGDLIRQRIAGVLGLADAGAAIQETFWAVRRLLESLARQKPLVTVFDDIHWGQTAFLDLLEYLVGSITDAPVLLLCLARPDLLDARPSFGTGQTAVVSMHLDPLTDGESRQLVRNLLGRAQVPEEALVRITQAAEGNPLFAEEMLRMLVDEGLLRKDGDTWVAIGDLSAVAIPPSIQAVLATRLDRLLADERAVIQRASVVGKVFWWGAVAELSDADAKSQVGTHIQSLVRKELIRPDASEFAGEDAFRFGHLLILDAAYESIPKQIRSELHERFAGWLEGTAGTRTVKVEEILAYHLEQAYRYRVELGRVDREGLTLATRAAERLGTAGLRASQHGDAPAAVNLLSRAVSLLAPSDPLRLELVPELGLALLDVGEFPRAEELLTEAIKAAREATNPGAEWWGRIVRSMWQFSTHPARWMRQAPAELPEAIKELSRVGHEPGLAYAWFLTGAHHMVRGRAAEWAEAAQRAGEHARRAERPGAEAAFIGLLTGALVMGPTPVDEGLRRCEELLQASEGNRFLQAQVLLRVAGFQAMVGRFADARGSSARALAIFEDLGLVSEAARTMWHQGDFELLAGDPASAEEYLRTATETLERLGERARLSGVAVSRAEANFELGRFEEALAYTQLAERVGSLDDVELKMRGRLLRAKLMARRGLFEESEAQAREAVMLGEDTDFLNLRGDALSTLGEVLRLAGKPGEAVSSLRAALRLYDQKGNLMSAARTERLLEHAATVPS